MKLALAIAVLGVWAAAASAQPGAPAQPTRASIDTLEVAIWPEYDRPEALVMYRATLKADAALPAEVALRVPAAVDKPHAVAKRGVDGKLYTVDHAYAVDGDWATVVMTTDSLHVQLEYYAPIQIEGGTRQFKFEWPGGPDVEQLTYELQEPFGASDFQVVPAATQRGQRGDGLSYNNGAVRGRKSGDAATFELSYNKADSRLTVQSLQPQRPVAPLATGRALLDSVPSDQFAAQTPPKPAAATKPSDKSGPSWALIAVLVVGAFGAGILIGRIWASAANSDEDKADS